MDAIDNTDIYDSDDDIVPYNYIQPHDYIYHYIVNNNINIEIYTYINNLYYNETTRLTTEQCDRIIEYLSAFR
jgi:hypothetical protein